MRPRLLDLFCGAGGAAMGWHRAGFDVVGVDIEPQPNYPFEFFQHDAIALLRLLIAGAAGFSEWPFYSLADLAAIGASPVCHDWSPLASVSGRQPRLASIPRPGTATGGGVVTDEVVLTVSPLAGDWIEGHMHLADQPCDETCEPDPRLRCQCLGMWNQPNFRDQCHRRATGEDLVCDDCRMVDVPLGAPLACAGSQQPSDNDGGSDA